MILMKHSIVTAPLPCPSTLNLPWFQVGFGGYGASSPRPEASRASRAHFGVAREMFLPAVGIGVVGGQTGSGVHGGAAGENIPLPHV